MRCPSCNSELEPGSKFCGVCGTAVTYVGSETDGFCGNCGAVMPAGANVCPSCGMPKYQTAMSVDRGHVNSYNNDEYRGTKVKSGLSGATIAVIAASAAVVVAAAVFGYIWISSGDRDGKHTGAAGDTVSFGRNNAYDPAIIYTCTECNGILYFPERQTVYHTG